MNSGLLAGFGHRPAALPRQPRRLARASNAATSQTGITTVVDLSGLSISFAVTIYPVRVRMWLPFVYGSVYGDMIVANITDLSNAVTASGGVNVGVANGVLHLIAEEEIAIPGSYSRKGRILRNTGTGTVNTYCDSLFTAYLEATEIKVAA